MTNSSLAMDYAKIFYEVCEEQGVKTQILFQTRQIKKIHNEDVRLILNLPTIEIEKKIKLISNLEGEVHPLILNLIKILIQRKHFSSFPQVMSEFQNIYQEKENITVVHVTTAREISAKNNNILVKKLEEKLGKMVVLLTDEDPSLIGGVKIEFGSKEIDNTIKRHLREFISQI